MCSGRTPEADTPPPLPDSTYTIKTAGYDIIRKLCVLCVCGLHKKTFTRQVVAAVRRIVFLAINRIVFVSAFSSGDVPLYRIRFASLREKGISYLHTAAPWI